MKLDLSKIPDAPTPPPQAGTVKLDLSKIPDAPAVSAINPQPAQDPSQPPQPVSQGGGIADAVGKVLNTGGQALLSNHKAPPLGPGTDFLNTDPIDRAKLAANGIAQGEGALLGGGASKAVGGLSDIAGMFSGDTYLSEQDKSVPTPQGQGRDWMNRAQQGLLGLGKLAGGLGRIALGLLPSTVEAEAGMGAASPEINAAAKGYQELWDTIPDNIKGNITYALKNTPIVPGNPLKIGDVADALGSLPEDMKRGASDALFTAALATLPGTARQYQKGLDWLNGPAEESEAETVADPMKDLQGRMKSAGVKPGQLDPGSGATALKMGEIDPDRADDLIAKSKMSAATGGRELPAIDSVADKMKDTLDKVDDVRKAAGEAKQAALEASGMADTPIDTTEATEKFENYISKTLKVGIEPPDDPESEIPKLDFSKSTVRFSAEDQKMLNDIHNTIAEGGTAEDIDTSKQALGSQVFKPGPTPAYSDGVEKAFKKGYGFLKDAVEKAVPGIKGPNSVYSDAVDLLQRSDRLGSKGDTFTQMLMKLSGNADDKVKGFVDDLAQFSKDNNIEGGDTIRDEALFANNSDKAAGVIPTRSFPGGIKQAIEAAASPAKTLGKAAGAILNPQTPNIDQMSKLVDYVRSSPETSSNPALIRFADLLEKDVMPKMTSIPGDVIDAITAKGKKLGLLKK